MGIGMGIGYKNLVPLDPYIHSLSAKGIKSIGSKVFPLVRVPYGKKSTPKKDREYKHQLGSSPVGTIKEWKAFGKKSGVDKLHINESDGSHFYVDIDAKGRKKCVKCGKYEPMTGDNFCEFCDEERQNIDAKGKLDKDSFFNKLQTDFPEVSFSTIQEFMDMHWQNLASNKKNLELFEDFISTAVDYDDMFPSPTRDLKLDARSQMFTMYGSKWKVVEKGRDTVLLMNRKKETLRITRDEYEEYKPQTRPTGDVIEEVVNAKGKKYYLMENIGEAKYTVNFYDGKNKHSDGSDFYNIKIFKNKKKMNDFVKELVSKDYKYGSALYG